MMEKLIRCDECKCQNRVPEGFLIDAYCRRCESALTIYTVFVSMLRSQTTMRSLQVAIAVAIVCVMFAGDVIAWWEAGPFRLDEDRASASDAKQALILPSSSLAYDPPVAPTE